MESFRIENEIVPNIHSLHIQKHENTFRNNAELNRLATLNKLYCNTNFVVQQIYTYVVIKLFNTNFHR